MPRNVAINSLATWMIEHPCIQETNFESSDSSNVENRVSYNLINKINLILIFFDF